MCVLVSVTLLQFPFCFLYNTVKTLRSWTVKAGHNYLLVLQYNSDLLFKKGPIQEGTCFFMIINSPKHLEPGTFLQILTVEMLQDCASMQEWWSCLNYFKLCHKLPDDLEIRPITTINYFNVISIVNHEFGIKWMHFIPQHMAVAHLNLLELRQKLVWGIVLFREIQWSWRQSRTQKHFSGCAFPGQVKPEPS